MSKQTEETEWSIGANLITKRLLKITAVKVKRKKNIQGNSKIYKVTYAKYNILIEQKSKREPRDEKLDVLIISNESFQLRYGVQRVMIEFSPRSNNVI